MSDHHELARLIRDALLSPDQVEMTGRPVWGLDYAARLDGYVDARKVADAIMVAGWVNKAARP